MISVNETTKNAYRADSSTKDIRLYFPDLDLEIETDQIDSESMNLSESVSEDESIEFVGCISSQFKITVHGISENLKGEYIEAYIVVGETEEISLFHGIVDDVSISADKSHKELKCYDELKTKGNKDIAEWYKALTFPITIKQFRDSLFTYVGITQEATILPNDDIVIDKQYSPNTMKAADVIKAICQINGVFGIINRFNVFEYRNVPKSENASVNEEIQYQKGLEYQEYIVNPVDKLTIRQNEQDEGVSYGDGDNNYIIQNNFFTLNLSEETLLQIAENIYPNIEGFYYVPFESDNNGFPWIECCDCVTYKAYDYDNSTPGNPIYKTLRFFILTRTLSGIQNLRDSYSAEGDEFQRVFITDLQTQVETIVQQLNEITGKLNDYSLNYVVFTNTNKLIVYDGNEVTTWHCEFAVQNVTQVMVNIEYLLDCETKVVGNEFFALKLKMNYYYDGNFIDSRQPEETYYDGKHILKLFYVLYVENPDIEHELEVRLVADGGNAILDIGQGLNVLVGQKLGGHVWNGKLVVKQTASVADLIMPTLITGIGIGAESVSTQFITPDEAVVTQIAGITTLIMPPSITTMNPTETISVSVEEVTQ